METVQRTVIKLGASTLVVSIPKKWADKLGIGPGSKVEIIDEGDDGVRILPYRPDGGRVRKCVLSTGECSPSLLARSIVACYLIGFDEIEIVAPEGEVIDSGTVSLVRKMVGSLSGVEVTVQTPNKIVLQSMVDPSRVKINEILARMITLNENMLEYLDLITKGRVEQVRAAEEMVKEMERLYRLAVRKLLQAQKDIRLMYAIGVSEKLNLLGNRTVAKALDDTNKALFSAARAAGRLAYDEMPNPVRNGLAELVDELKEICSRASEAFLKLDHEKAYRTLEALADFRTRVEEFMTEILESGGVEKWHSSLILTLSNIAAATRHMAVVCEVAFNRALEEPGRSCRVG